MRYKIEIHRLVPAVTGPQYADDRSPLLEMTTEFPDLAAINLRLLADRLDREVPDPGPLVPYDTPTYSE